MGKRIKSLVNKNQDAEYRSISWDATNDFGQPRSSGMYIYTIQEEEFRQTRKMVLLK
tara:strand:- start:59 stop:229 length:171 start_codon:yes stop_codon:yes gene_type:complete